MTLPEIPDEVRREAVRILNIWDRESVEPAEDCLEVLWPHLYAAALRHARCEMSATDDVGGPEDIGYAAALRDHRILADEATA